ncbi:hypothetical protein QZH41_003960 [Actinostola sp. cb2023]|nr:hypothetical protein QZH41_003960 [Actinostola sp. cb2023]
MQDSLKTFKFKPRIKEKYDLRLCLQGKKKALLNRLQRELASKRGIMIKWFVSVQVKFIKPKADGTDITSEPHFRSLCTTTVNPEEVEEQLNEVNQKILNVFAIYQREGSGWMLSEVLHLDLNIAQYTPIKGSSYLPLPKQLKDKKAIVNIKNNDNRCFMWSILAALHKVERHSNPERIHHYQPYLNQLNFNDIEFPVSISKIPKFEKQNQISVNVFGFEEGALFPVHISEERYSVHVDLLLYSLGQQHHYCLIRDLNRLLSNQRKHNGKMFHCPHCLHGFVRQDLLDDHQPLCSQHGAQRIELPNENNMFLQFKDFHKQLRVPFAIYADFESLTTKIESASPDPTKSSTEKYQHHQACGFAYVIVSERPDYCKAPVLYRGEDAVDEFLESLQKEEQRIETLLEDIVPMQLTPLEEDRFQHATLCHICKDELGADRVRDHCHVTGKFRGAAHNACNLNFQFTGRIPVILIMQGLGKIKNKPINCIPNNIEKYLSFSIGNLDFIDSLQFMNTSLEKLVCNLAKEGDNKFSILKKYIETSKVPLLLRKGVYPYDYMDNIEKFKEPQLPPKEAFYSKLTKEHISGDDYHHAQTVFTTFQLQNLGEYHDLYLLSDVLLLADVFENFRNICLNYYELDPAHFYTSPGLAWSACLKMIGRYHTNRYFQDDLRFAERRPSTIFETKGRTSYSSNQRIHGRDKYYCKMEGDYIFGILRADVRNLGKGARLTNQDGIVSRHLVCFLDSGEEFHFGFGYRNGSNVRVVCWENGAKKNKTTTRGTFIIIFDDVITPNGRNGNFTANDFKFAWFNDAAQTNAKKELLLAVERGEEISDIIDRMAGLTIEQLNSVGDHIENLRGNQ